MLADSTKPTAGAMADVVRQPNDAEQAGEQQQLRARLAELQRDAELRQLQLEQAQEELDAAYERLASEASGRWRNAMGSHADALYVLDDVESPPHRHLHVDLRHARLDDRHWDALEVRLLEHHGHPGLAYFAAGGAAEPVSAWQASGHENGREFMLIVPSDSAGQSLLTNLGSSDWRAVRGTVELLVQHLRLAKDDRAARWLLIALRLQSQLEAIPPRLRFDAAQVEADPAEGGWLRTRFGNVEFGGRLLGDVRLRWHPARDELRWLAPTRDAAIPLANWPLDSAGALQAELALPLGRQVAAAQRRRWWAGLSASDRMLVLEVLKALPGALRQLPAGLPEAVVVRAASRLHRDTRRSWLRWRLGMAARRLLRRDAALTRK
jgi:hypothetical protein